MNTRSILIAVTIGLAGAGGYWLGTLSNGDSKQGAIVKPRESPVAPPVRTSAFTLPPGVAGIIGDAPLSDEAAAAAAFHGLEAADPVRRMAAVTLILESMTPSNARAIYKSFVDVTKKTGRRHDVEWGLMLKKYGEVLGAQALKDVQPVVFNMTHVIEGIAAADPAAAAAVLKASGVKDKALTIGMLTGICRKDPVAAFNAALQKEFADIDSGGLLKQAVQAVGLDGALDALQKALDAESEEAGNTAAFRGLFDALADSIMHKNITNGTPGETLKWLEKQKGQPYISGKLLDNAARDTANRGNIAEAVSWVERMNSGDNPSMGGGQGLYDVISSDTKHLSAMDKDTFGRFVALIPKDPDNFEFLAALAAQVNPEYASRLREAMPQQQPQVPVKLEPR